MPQDKSISVDNPYETIVGPNIVGTYLPCSAFSVVPWSTFISERPRLQAVPMWKVHTRAPVIYPSLELLSPINYMTPVYIQT
jgi:hypothetical protein